MGLRDTLALLRSSTSITQSVRYTERNPISPWQRGGGLEHIAWSDIFGTTYAPVTFGEAMRVPAVAKGRAILHSIITPRPMRAYDKTGPVADQPTWLYRSDTGIAPQQRLGQILDDCIFYGASLLLVARGADGFPVDSEPCSQERWNVEPTTGIVYVDGEPADPRDYIYIPGPSGGLLTEAADTIRGARDITRAWINRVRTPLPSLVFKETDANAFDSDDDARDFVANTAAARRSPDGMVMLIPFGVDQVPQSLGDDAQLFENGRNALRIDIANHLNIPAALLDGSPNTASLTYDTREGQRNDLQDLTVSYWTTPIEAALSVDSVCPRGQRIRIDFTDYVAAANAPTGAITED